MKIENWPELPICISLDPFRLFEKLVRVATEQLGLELFFAANVIELVGQIGLAKRAVQPHTEVVLLVVHVAREGGVVHSVECD